MIIFPSGERVIGGSGDRVSVEAKHDDLAASNK
jgi:hypothetical protein